MAAEIVDFGITAGTRTEGEATAGPNALTPPHAMSGVRYIQRTDRIEARLCRSFGLRIKLDDRPPRRVPSRVDVLVRHPTLTRPDGKQSAETRFPSYVNNGMSAVGFTFDHDWEMVAGTWTIIVSSRGEELARKVFTITMPVPGAPNSDCGVS